MFYLHSFVEKRHLPTINNKNNKQSAQVSLRPEHNLNTDTKQVYDVIEEEFPEFPRFRTTLPGVTFEKDEFEYYWLKILFGIM